MFTYLAVFCELRMGVGGAVWVEGGGREREGWCVCVCVWRGVILAYAVSYSCTIPDSSSRGTGRIVAFE